MYSTDSQILLPSTNLASYSRDNNGDIMGTWICFTTVSEEIIRLKELVVNFKV